MSQKENNFQSKPKRAGQKFGERRGESRRDYKPESRGDYKPNGRKDHKPESRNFSERPQRDRDDRPDRSAGRPSSGRPPERSFDRSSARPFDRDSRPPRRDFGDKPYKKRESGDRNDRDGNNPYRKREFGGNEGRRNYKPENRSDSRPEVRKEFSDRPYKKREFGDKKPYGREKPFFDKYNSRPQKSYERYEERPVSASNARQKLKSDRPAYGAPSAAYLYGLHAVTQALLNPKRVHQRLLCTQKSYESLADTRAEALEAGIALPEVTYVEKEDIERLLPRDAVHQDILLDCRPLEEIELLDLLPTVPDNARILVLDQVTDPHNIGAILRSAAAFGAVAVVMQKLHAPDITGTLAKSASGAVELVPLIREVNLSRALEQLKEAGFFCIGLDENGKQPLARLNLTGKTALVLGAEGSGLRRLVAENCDELAKLPTQGPIGSLNVSNAAAVALYELTRAS